MQIAPSLSHCDTVAIKLMKESPPFQARSQYNILRFSVAPMLGVTDRHCRHFFRLLSKHATLYTEMITTGALLHGDTIRFLRHDLEDNPVVLQLGGNNPKELAYCASLAENGGYCAVNLNIGCPSSRVQNGRIGACLMAEPRTVAKMVKTMCEASSLPITVKHRIGIDQQNSYQSLVDFVGRVADAGCQTFIVHARIALLSGLSPSENRSIPPLKPQWVYQLKQDFPQLNIIINGGISTTEAISQHLKQVDGVMLGREVWHNPYFLAQIDSMFYGDDSPKISREDIVQKMVQYIDKEQAESSVRLHQIVRHIYNLYRGIPGGRLFRRYLSEYGMKQDARSDVLLKAHDYILHAKK